MEQEIKVCKKCQRPLPIGYKYMECEHCRGEKVGMAKKVGKGILAGAGTVLSIAVIVATKGKFGGGGKA